MSFENGDTVLFLPYFSSNAILKFYVYFKSQSKAVIFDEREHGACDVPYFAIRMRAIGDLIGRYVGSEV